MNYLLVSTTEKRWRGIIGSQSVPLLLAVKDRLVTRNEVEGFEVVHENGLIQDFSASHFYFPGHKDAAKKYAFSLVVMPEHKVNDMTEADGDLLG